MRSVRVEVGVGSSVPPSSIPGRAAPSAGAGEPRGASRCAQPRAIIGQQRHLVVAPGRSAAGAGLVGGAPTSPHCAL